MMKPVNDAQKISELVKRFGSSVQIFERKYILGFIPFTIYHGWLWIEDTNDYWSVILANNKTTHQPLDGPALGADFRKDNGERKIGPLDLTGTWKSNISMWPIRNEDEAIQVFNFVSSKIDMAFRYHLNTA